jgi:hypothetical protein
VLDFRRSWAQYLPFIKFVIGDFWMPPYEALYGHKCQSPLYRDNIGRDNVGRRQLWKGQHWKETTLGPEMIQVLTIGRRMSAS